MKIISWGIIFVIVIFSFSFINRVILNDKMEIMKEEVKYNNALELATADATSELKSQMNTIEGVYNETQEMMLTVAKRFFDSFSMGFGYYGGNSKESIIKMYVPAIAMMTYDGLYMYTLDYVTDNAGNQYLEHTLKPEIKYSYNDTINKINFTLDNTIILENGVDIIDYSNPLMESYIDPLTGDYITRQKTDAYGNLIYGIKETNTGKIVDLNHYYDIAKRGDGTFWEEKIGDYYFTFYKEGDVCYADNNVYMGVDGTVYEVAEEDVIRYEKSFYMKNGIRYLLEEWRKRETDELIEQRLTEYTEEQLIFTQDIEAQDIESTENKYGETIRSNVGGYVTWDTEVLNISEEYITYLTRGNPENEGFTNPLTGKYEIGEFHKVRRETITKKIKDNLEYYILLHNKFAANNGITYTFTVPEIKSTDMENAITDMSVLAFVQGIPMVSGDYYNNYGVAGAKVIQQERFYAMPAENPVEAGRIPTYYSSREIGSANTYLFERNNAKIFDNAKDAADYGYYPNIDGSISETLGVQRNVWKIDIVKEGFNCVKSGDIITLPVIIPDDIIPSEIKWAEGTKSRYYFSNSGNLYNSGTKSGANSIYYEAGSVIDTAVNEEILDGSPITWQYAIKDGQRVIMILINVGQAPSTEFTTSYTVFIRDADGNSEVATISGLKILNDNMEFNINGGRKIEDDDTDATNNTISGMFLHRKWENLQEIKGDSVNGYMAYWIKGNYELNTTAISNEYNNLYLDNTVQIDGNIVNKLTYTGDSSWSFSPEEYGTYTLFAWDCTGRICVTTVTILPQLQITYVMEAYNDAEKIATINYNSANEIEQTIIYKGENIGTHSGDAIDEITEQVTKANVYISINRTEEQLRFVEYKKGNFDVVASAGIEQYIANTGTSIIGSYVFELTENNYYTVYVEDNIDVKRCVQINFELVTSAFIPDFNNWIIPDIEYQKYYKPYYVDNGNVWSNNSYRYYWNAETNIDGYAPNDICCRPLLRTERTLTFGGYTSRDCRDVIFTNADAQYEIVFKYTINDANVSYHSSKGAGFLFDCNVTTTTRSDGCKDYTLNSGYLLLYEQSYIYLYRITNPVNLTDIRNSGYTPYTTVGYGTKLSGGIHETRLEVRQIDDTHQRVVLKEKNSSGVWQEIMNTTITHTKKAENAYGVIMMHNGHNCSETSAFKFNNMSIIQKAYTD